MYRAWGWVEVQSHAHIEFSSGAYALPLCPSAWVTRGSEVSVRDKSTGATKKKVCGRRHWCRCGASLAGVDGKTCWKWVFESEQWQMCPMAGSRSCGFFIRTCRVSADTCCSPRRVDLSLKSFLSCVFSMWNTAQQIMMRCSKNVTYCFYCVIISEAILFRMGCGSGNGFTQHWKRKTGAKHDSAQYSSTDVCSTQESRVLQTAAFDCPWLQYSKGIEAPYCAEPTSR